MILPMGTSVAVRAGEISNHGADQFGAAAMLVMPAAPDQHVSQQGNHRHVGDKPIHFRPRSGLSTASLLVAELAKVQLVTSGG